jgi:hypothetical protein
LHWRVDGSLIACIVRNIRNSEFRSANLCERV